MARRRKRTIPNVSQTSDMEAVEFLFDAGGPIPLADLASSFSAIDSIYLGIAIGGERLAVTELRSGSILGELAPVVPVLNHVLPFISAGNTLSDFRRKIKKAIDGFAELGSPSVPAEPDLAAEIAQVMRPLAGRKDARFGIRRVRYKSSSAERTVEVEAEYVSSDIDRAVINAERAAELFRLTPPEIADAPAERNYLRGVTMILHQANRGPAKAKGATGDRGVIEAVSEKPLPVYFAEGVNRLKDRMVRSTKNPLKYAYVVDAWVHREGGKVKGYTVTDVHSAARLDALPRRKKSA